MIRASPHTSEPRAEKHCMPNTTKSGEIICKVCSPSQQQSAKHLYSHSLRRFCPIPLCKLVFSSQTKGWPVLETHSLIALWLKSLSQKHTVTRTSLALIFYPNSLFLGRNIRVPRASHQLQPWWHQAALGSLHTFGGSHSPLCYRVIL